jgi:Uma2 family endonuclease
MGRNAPLSESWRGWGRGLQRGTKLMVEVKIGFKTLDLPYTIRLYGVTEETFDELSDEDTKAELIDGVMIVHSPATIWHDDIGGFLRSLMGFYNDEKGLGIVLGPDSLVHLAVGRKFAPDIFFVSKERVPRPLPKEFDGAPDLVVEILSPSNRNDDLNDKRAAYREAGVGEIWFVDGEYRKIIADRKQGEGYVEDMVTEGRVASTALHGFWADASWLWAEPLPSRMSCLQEILR